VIATQHAASSHEASFTDPIFQAQYFEEVLPRARGNAAILGEAARCTACHSPVTFVSIDGAARSTTDVDPRTSGVTCDFCHTISGYTGSRPENGNYVSTPGGQKLGPYRHKSTWHHDFSELQTKSDFCGICHDATNHNGVAVKSTFSEWQSSRYAERGIQCQDCHMSEFGRLVAGTPLFESGHAAHMTVGTAPERERLFNHRFPGMHTAKQLAGAVTLTIETEPRSCSPGQPLTIAVLLTNATAGHRLPTGSADLRQMWLTLEADLGKKVVPISATAAAGSDGFDVAGKGRFDGEILGADIPAGSRLYRTVFLDALDHQTLRSYDATRMVFDNRLDPLETRRETYRFVVPASASGEIVVRARVNYLAYPSSFAARLGVPPAQRVEIASTNQVVRIR
jgi:hypothetical protein